MLLDYVPEAKKEEYLEKLEENKESGANDDNKLQHVTIYTENEYEIREITYADTKIPPKKFIIHKVRPEIDTLFKLSYIYKTS